MGNTCSLSTNLCQQTSMACLMALWLEVKSKWDSSSISQFFWVKTIMMLLLIVLMRRKIPWPSYKHMKRKGYKLKKIWLTSINVSTFLLSELEETIIFRPCGRWVIVKMLCRKIGYKALETRLKHMWVSNGVINI